jgi:hypothetical protein
MQSWESYKSFYPLWCWVWLVSYESVVVCHPSRYGVAVWGSMLWFEQRLKWWRWLIPSWHLVLESAKDRFFGVDIPGQHVSPRVWYVTAYLLISNAIGCVSCSVEWGLASLFVSYFVTYFMKMPEPHGTRGAFTGESLALQAGPLLGNL